MERLTISMSDEFAAELALFMASHQYDNRSEISRAVDCGKPAWMTAWLARVSRRYPMCSTTTHENWRSG